MFSETKRRLRRAKPGLFPNQSYEQQFNFRAVEESALYRCSQPTIDALYYFQLVYGVRSFIIVRSTPREFELEYARSGAMPILWINLLRRKPAENEIQEFLNFMRNEKHHPVLLHCAAGKDRTGFFSLLYRIEFMGWDVHTAWEEMLALGHRAFPWERRQHGYFKSWLENHYNVKLKG